MSKIKITVTVDEDLVCKLDLLSEKRKENRSKLVEEAIKNWYKSQLEQELIAGYQAMAEEDKKTAEENLPLAREIIGE